MNISTLLFIIICKYEYCYFFSLHADWLFFVWLFCSWSGGLGGPPGVHQRHAERMTPPLGDAAPAVLIPSPSCVEHPPQALVASASSILVRMPYPNTPIVTLGALCVAAGADIHCSPVGSNGFPISCCTPFGTHVLALAPPPGKPGTHPFTSLWVLLSLDHLR